MAAQLNPKPYGLWVGFPGPFELALFLEQLTRCSAQTLARRRRGAGSAGKARFRCRAEGLRCYLVDIWARKVCYNILVYLCPLGEVVLWDFEVYPTPYIPKAIFRVSWGERVVMNLNCDFGCFRLSLHELCFLG